MVTKHGAYIDAFAGPQEPDNPDMWAARLVLTSEPRRIRQFYLCEKDSRKVKALNALVASAPRIKPTRHIRVLPGDCNVEIPVLLNTRPIREKEATFCLLDQRTFECHWATIEALAQYKKSGHKIELFYFLANAWFDRAVAASKTLRGKQRIFRWWGRQDWTKLRALSPLRRANALAERFRNELGYAHSHPWPIYQKADGGRVMYYMIHASDHPDAAELMSRAYMNAVRPEDARSQLRLSGIP